MKAFRGGLMILIGLFMVAAALRASQPTARVLPAAPSFKPVATIQDIMSTMIDPASKVVFGAVATENVGGDEKQKAPQNDAEWRTVRNNALMMVEGANLIMMSGRHIAKDLTAKGGEGELGPGEIEKRMSQNRALWNKLAREFNAAATIALKAAEAKDADAIFASGENIDTACENCHLTFWYPDQDQLFKKPPAPAK